MITWERLRARRPLLIAVSGIDGSGKSTLVEGLRERLGRNGYQVEVVWTRLEWTTLWESSGRLERIAALVNWLPARRRPAPAKSAPAEPSSAWLQPAPPRSAAAQLRRRSRLLTRAWASVVAAMHAQAQRNAVMPHLRDGKVVICDRYTLDAAVALHRRYDTVNSLGPQVRLMELLSPRPLLAWHLDVPAAVAAERKWDELGIDERQRENVLYRRERERLGARWLDASRPVDELVEQVTREVEAALAGIAAGR
ncbi:MAG: dTMP kinase [Thermoleophilaceae bacterium]